MYAYMYIYLHIYIYIYILTYIHTPDHRPRRRAPGDAWSRFPLLVTQALIAIFLIGLSHKFQLYNYQAYCF